MTDIKKRLDKLERLVHELAAQRLQEIAEPEPIEAYFEASQKIAGDDYKTAEPQKYGELSERDEWLIEKGFTAAVQGGGKYDYYHWFETAKNMGVFNYAPPQGERIAQLERECEWIQGADKWWHPSCKHNQAIYRHYNTHFRHFNYCPYCRGKITAIPVEGGE